jgi:hypothetical protein
MNQNEFREWFAYHQTRFPAINDDLAKASVGPEAPKRKDILAAWASAMRDCTVTDAKDATDAIHSGREKKPFRVEDWPGAVAMLCRKYAASRREAKPVYHGGERAVRCRDCQDTGYVTCWHPRALAALAACPPFRSGALVSCAVPCHCDSALRHIDPRSRGNATRYESARWCKLDWLRVGDRQVMASPSDPEQQAAALAWLEEWRNNRATLQPGYESGFEEFAGGPAQAQMEF